DAFCIDRNWDDGNGILLTGEPANGLGIDIADAVNQLATPVLCPLVSAKHPPLERGKSTHGRELQRRRMPSDDFELDIVGVAADRQFEAPAVLEHAHGVAIDRVEAVLFDLVLELGEHRSIEMASHQERCAGAIPHQQRTCLPNSRARVQVQCEAVAAAAEIGLVATLRFVADKSMAMHFVFPRQNAKRVVGLDSAAGIKWKRHCFREKQQAHDQWKRSMPPRNTSTFDRVSGWVRRSRMTRGGLPTARL